METYSSTLAGKSHGWRSLVGCGPWGREQLNMTERLPFHFSLSWIGEGNGDPLGCSCLENPRNEGAWWAVVYRVAQSRTRLKRLSSSSSNTEGKCVTREMRLKPAAAAAAAKSLQFSQISSVQSLSHV